MRREAGIFMARELLYAASLIIGAPTTTKKKPGSPAKTAPEKKPAKKTVTKAPAKKTVTKPPAKKTVTKAPAKKTVTKPPAKKAPTKAPSLVSPTRQNKPKTPPKSKGVQVGRGELIDAAKELTRSAREMWGAQLFSTSRDEFRLAFSNHLFELILRVNEDGNMEIMGIAPTDFKPALERIVKKYNPVRMPDYIPSGRRSGW